MALKNEFEDVIGNKVFYYNSYYSSYYGNVKEEKLLNDSIATKSDSTSNIYFEFIAESGLDELNVETNESGTFKSVSGFPKKSFITAHKDTGHIALTNVNSSNFSLKITVRNKNGKIFSKTYLVKPKYVAPKQLYSKTGNMYNSYNSYYNVGYIISNNEFSSNEYNCDLYMDGFYGSLYGDFYLGYQTTCIAINSSAVDFNNLQASHFTTTFYNQMKLSYTEYTNGVYNTINNYTTKLYLIKKGDKIYYMKINSYYDDYYYYSSNDYLNVTFKYYQ